jgi:hypothetical protein
LNYSNPVPNFTEAWGEERNFQIASFLESFVTSTMDYFLAQQIFKLLYSIPALEKSDLCPACWSLNAGLLIAPARIASFHSAMFPLFADVFASGRSFDDLQVPERR